MTQREKIDTAVAYLQSKLGFTPDLAIVLGSGLGGLATKITDPILIPYGEVPNFPISTAPGHAGQFVAGKIGDKHVLAMQGRFHYYEGYDMSTIALPIEVLKTLGCKALVLTNAAGGVNLDFKVGVVGAGALGTALAQMIAENVDEVLLYARRKSVADAINNTGYNEEYYPNIKVRPNIRAVNDFKEFNNVEMIFLCIPSSTVRSITAELNDIISKDCILINTAKGLEVSSYKPMSIIIGEETGRPAVAFSGPNIASEMMKGLFTASTIASKNEKYLNDVKNVLESDKFKVNANNDVIGTEYCGIIKNILAISQGIFEGMNINDNARFAIFSKSYIETKDIIEKLGGMRDTVDDYCGFGDIITASTLTVSRNHTLGTLYGQGIIIDENKSGVLFEGKNTVSIFKNIIEDLNVKSTIVDFVYEVIIENKNPKTAFVKLWDNL